MSYINPSSPLERSRTEARIGPPGLPSSIGRPNRATPRVSISLLLKIMAQIGVVREMSVLCKHIDDPGIF